MIISIASGKGGTGKTTVATNLAASLNRPVTLLDCDVEEPNAHLFIQTTVSDSEVVDTFVPSVDETKCTGCKKCMELCEFNALTVLGERVLVFPELCHSCEGCLEICPEKAIHRGSRELGSIEIGTYKNITLIYGSLRVGEAMSPPLISRVRRKASMEQPVIIDAPPGTSCPAINSIKNTDFVVLVTEPTPFGLHDLGLAFEAVASLKIPCGLVINRSNLGDRQVYDFASRNNIPIVLEIPFDRQIATCYSEGRLVVEESPSWRQQYQHLFEQITNNCKSEQYLT